MYIINIFRNNLMVLHKQTRKHRHQTTQRTQRTNKLNQKHKTQKDYKGYPFYRDSYNLDINKLW